MALTYRVTMCRECGMGVNTADPMFHAERYGHIPEWADDSEPAEVLVNGQVHYRCSVCEDRIMRSRSELDASGRCDDCRP